MRLAFMGTPAFAVPTLERLVADGHEVAAVYTQPPRPAGRGRAPQPSPVQRRAEALGLTVHSPERLRGADEQAAWAALDLDAAVVAAYGLLLPVPVLEAPRLGCLNVHASLLPRWRGAAPIQRAILAGDAQTGVTIMDMEAGLDTGPMRLSQSVPVNGKTAGELTDELASLGADLMARVLADPAAFPPVPQPENGVTHAPKVRKEEARIDWAQSATVVERQIRAFAPAPGAWFEIKGERVRVHAVTLEDGAGAPGTVLDDALLVACGEGALRLRTVQRAGRGVMTAAELLRGFPVHRSAVLA